MEKVISGIGIINSYMFGGKMRITLLLVFISSLVFCQNPNGKYVNAPFEKGLPTRIPFKWNNTLYSSVNGGEYYKSLFVVSRDSLKTEDKCFLFVFDNDNNFSLSAISFIKFGDNVFKSLISLNSQEEDKLSPLHLELNLNERTLNYWWENKNIIEYKFPKIIEEYPLKIGKMFPLLNIETEKGNWSSKPSNKIIVINWWATSCIPCIEEMPGLNELVNKYSEDKIEFVAIVWDKDNYAQFISKHTFNYLQGYGNEKTFQLFGGVFPRNIIIDRTGKIIYNKTGALKETYKKLDNILKSIL